MSSIRLLKALFSNSLQTLKPQSKSKPLIFPPNLPLVSQSHLSPKPQFTTTRFISSTAPEDDNLEGLIDPEDHVPKGNAQGDSIPSSEFEFLRISLLGIRDSDKKNVGLVKSNHLGESTCSDSDAVLVANTLRSNNDGFGDKTQKFLRQFRGKLDGKFVVEVLNSVKNPELGVKFFIWAGRQIGYSHTSGVYDALLEVLGCNDSRRVPDSLLKEIKEDDREVLGKLLNFLVKKCCQNGLWNLALEELGRLKDFGHRPTRITYNALIQVFLNADRLASAELVHREMLDAGFHLDGHTLGCFVYFLCRKGKWREALDLIEKEEPDRDTVLYTRMISGLCEASLFEEAMNILDRMRSDSCIPNVVTYSVLLSGCLKKRQLGRCKRILNMMMTEGCYPSLKIFNSLVHACCRSGDYSSAYKLFKKMIRCGYNPGYVTYNIFIGGICGNEELPSSDGLELAEKAYAEMLGSGVILNKINVSNFARCLCGAEKFEKAYVVIHQMMSKGFIPDSSTYCKVISLLCNASRVENAFSLFKEMKGNGIIPDVYTYTVLIDSFCKVGLVEQAHNLFNEMVRNGCAPNVVTYTALIHGYLKARKVANANELFNMMLSHGCSPNIITYTALIDGHCKAGDVEKACQIYSRMRGNVDPSDIDNYYKVSEEDSQKPNVYTYGALIDGLCKAHKVKEASDLLYAMHGQGCEPNLVVYDALIDGFCKVGKLDEAQAVLTKMSELGYGPSAHTYGSLIDRLFKDKRLDLVMEIVSKMLENSCAPNVVIYTEMVDGLCKVGKIDEAYRLLQMMEEKGCHPNVVTYTAMIDGFGKAGKLNQCLELKEHMISKGCAPNFVTYGVLIKHCCSVGLLDEAYQLLEEMKLTYWPKHMAGYQKVIEGFNKEFMVSLGLLDEMGKTESLPLIPAYTVLIDNFAKVGRLEVALDLYEEIKSSSFSSAGCKNIYTSLIESLSLSGMVDKAFELYTELISRGGIPELSTFVHLIRGLIRISKWEEALLLSDCICRMDICWVKDEKES